MRQLVYTMLITYNHASFHLWWKENSVKYQKVAKYFGYNWNFQNLCLKTIGKTHRETCHFAVKYIKKTPSRVLFCWFYDFAHNTFFTEYLQANVSVCVFVVFVDFIYVFLEVHHLLQSLLYSVNYSVNLRIQSKYGKMRNRKTLNSDTFHT